MGQIADGRSFNNKCASNFAVLIVQNAHKNKLVTTTNFSAYWEANVHVKVGLLFF